MTLHITNMRRFILSTALAVFSCQLALHMPVAVAEDTPPPTYANVRYGPHPRNVLDLWKVESSDPVPLVVMIHGGGWKGGDKQRQIFSNWSKPAFERIQKAGISIAAINYRLSSAEHPVPAPLLDAARAIQFLRTKASRWNLDPQRFAAYGGSAGACSSLWLAMHDDLADPNSDDPVLRQSSRLSCAAAINGQSTIYPEQMRPWVGPLAEQHAMIRDAFGLKTVARSYEAGHKQDYIEYSPITHLDKTDPPLFLTYQYPNSPAKTISHAIHHPMYGIKLKEPMDKLGIECWLVIAGQTYQQEKKYEHYADFLIEKLKSK